MLGAPPDDQMPGAVKRFVVDTHNTAADIMSLHGFTGKLAADILDPGGEVMGS